MNLLRNLFAKREGRMDATAERSESELRARLAEVQVGIAEGAGDVVALLEERDDVQRALEAARITREARQNDEYRAEIAARRERLVREINVELEAVWATMPRLRWAMGAASAGGSPGGTQRHDLGSHHGLALGQRGPIE